MPYEWIETAPEDSGAVIILTVWLHHSLPRKGFAWVIGLAAAGLALPLLSILGTAALWGLLPFAVIAVWGLWAAIRRSYRAPREVMRIARAELVLTRSDPGRPDRIWRTNPYWLRATLRANGPVPDYLVLTDGRREIELGAFLSPEERRSLHQELTGRLRRLR
ncbi:DUF2244 domain-containing protein [Paracoccus ravus]|uniref:DUF2244 domain-containing protein n=1 Tax=Paracoccus ravus TaxID=2447760 RepID=UPI00106E93F8|nr:DUF2244 domain-containing protein [Paracoccus ravus]